MLLALADDYDELAADLQRLPEICSPPRNSALTAALGGGRRASIAATLP